MNLNLEIGLILVGEMALLALPAIAAAWFAAARGMRSQALLIAVALVASGATAMLAFWAFYAAPQLGKVVAALVILASAAALVALWFDGRGRAQMRELATPFALWVLATWFIVFFGFLHSTNGEALETSAHRFSHELPIDNFLPSYFAEWFYLHGHQGVPPPFGEWLASDRPPLQTGYILALSQFGVDLHHLPYELLGVALQQFWVPAAWALLRAAGLGRRVRALAMVAAMVSDIAIVHGFFVWPKLIAAGFLLAAAALVLSPEWKRWVRDARVAALFAALCTLAMLSHGSSAFMLLPLVVLAFWRSLPSWRWIAVAAASTLVLYAPWQAYQHWGDPPGNRLVKWQLGGSEAIDGRGVLRTIADGYRAEGVGGTLENKWRNVQAMVGVGEVRSALDGTDNDESSGGLARTIEDLRWIRFLALLPNIGFLLLGPLALGARALRERGRDWGVEGRFVRVGGALALATAALWALLMFGNEVSEAVIHQGALAVPLLAILVCVVAAYATSPRFAATLVAFNAAFVLVLYAPAFSAVSGPSYSVVAGLIAALALAGFCRLAWLAPGVTEGGQYTHAP